MADYLPVSDLDPVETDRYWNQQYEEARKNAPAGMPVRDLVRDLEEKGYRYFHKARARNSFWEGSVTTYEINSPLSDLLNTTDFGRVSGSEQLILDISTGGIADDHLGKVSRGLIRPEPEIGAPLAFRTKALIGISLGAMLLMAAIIPGWLAILLAGVPWLGHVAYIEMHWRKEAAKNRF